MSSPSGSKTIFVGIVLLSCLFKLPLQAQPDTWKKKTSGFGYAALSIAIGNKVYRGINHDSPEFREYDLLNNSWIKKADFPGEKRDVLTSFSLNSKIYVMCGRSVERYHSDFWEYEPVTDEWTSLGVFPGGYRYNMFALTVQGKAYVGAGFNGTYLNELWVYDPVRNSWEKKASLPTEGREGPIYFSIRNKIYVGGGKANYKDKHYNDFWEYDPLIDAWNRKADIPGKINWKNWFFSIGNFGYVGQRNEELNNVYEYNVCYDIWTIRNDFDKSSTTPYDAFSTGKKGYVIVWDSTNFYSQSKYLSKHNSLWEYTPPALPSTATILDVSPAEGEIGSRVTITGTDFEFVPDLNIVEFNGVKAKIDSSSYTHIYTTVPAGATTGIVSVFTDCIQATGGVTIFTVIIRPPLWLRWWAFIGYGLIFIGLLLAGRNVVVNRERKKFNAEMERKQIEALRESERLKTKFFSNITHEFRTPLTLILGPANELYEHEEKQESRQLLELIRSNSNRLLKLINQLLDLAKLDAQEMKLILKHVSLTNFFTSVISQFTSLAHSRKIEFTWTLPKELPSARVDDAKLEAIITNLISNALKFTPETGSINVIVAYKNNILQLEVIDTGRGIPPAKLAHIFDRFYQVEATDSTHAEGTGIGLALVKEYVEVMRGKIEVESTPGKGTRFIVEIPITVSHVQDMPTSAPTLAEKATSLENYQQPETSLPLVLLAEDHDDIRVFIKLCLGNDFRYTEARNGREALAIALEQLPDLIISDLMMPEMDGMEFCERAKKDKRTDHIPFIMLTAKAAEESKLEGLNVGADDYLVKPFNKAELLAKVRNLITLQKNLQTHLKRSLLAQSTPVHAVSAEEQFILKAKTYVEANLADSRLSVETLANEMNLGQKQCYRKLLALTGLSPSAFIRNLRLHKAAQLLAAKWGGVSQVAYEVGFENLSHFSKAFKEEFGKLPSEYEG